METGGGLGERIDESGRLTWLLWVLGMLGPVYGGKGLGDIVRYPFEWFESSPEMPYV